MDGDGLEGEAGREYGGQRHNHFVCWVMMGGRGMVGRRFIELR